jgi:asparagine synthase (glutamine-hydrolysing)
MCGITGFIDTASGNNRIDTLAAVKEMTSSLSHRGPDDNGIWYDQRRGIYLGHTRLAVIDVSPAGRQPMISDSGRYVISYNGEIYNYREIKSELKRKSLWNGHSDTEVLLGAVEEFGFTETLPLLKGMFALALWDRKEGTLYLARDKCGEKPLYYGWNRGYFLFSSELKAIKKFPGISLTVDEAAVSFYFQLNYVPEPYSIFQSICKVPKGSYVKIEEQSGPGYFPEPVHYWSFAQEVSGDRDTVTGEDLETVLSQSVERQMISDVPLGAFLSGGIDSSLITALMQERSSAPVKTFTIGFKDSRYDESVYARRIAEHLGTEHTELFVTQKETLEAVPKMPEIFDEPFADSSQIPTYVISELIRRYVTVCLSGDGGDELFAGYNRYLWVEKIGSLINRMPGSLRRTMGRLLLLLNARELAGFVTITNRVFPSRLPAKLDQLIQKFAYSLTACSEVELYRKIVSIWQNPEEVVTEYKDTDEYFTTLFETSKAGRLLETVRRMDMKSYLSDDILVKVDRSSMAVSLETRVPFLDSDVLSSSFRIPFEQKISHGKSKWILRQILYKYVPRNLVERPKMGFAVPMDEWLRGPLKKWARSVLNKKDIREHGFFSYDAVQEKWIEHMSGRKNRQDELWNAIMFQCWLNYN